MKFKNFFFYAVFIFVFSSIYQPLISLTVGSNTAVSVAGFTAFPTGPNLMLGFAAFANGISLASGTALVTYNDFFPLGGPITFNTGTLSLVRNLTLSSNATINNGGTILLNGFALDLPVSSSPITIPALTTISNGEVTLNSDITLAGRLLLTGNVLIEGSGYTIDCTNGALACGTGAASVQLKNVTLRNASGNRMYCLDNTGTFSLQDVKWILDANYTFTQGGFDIFNIVSISGSRVFTYRSTRNLTIRSNATLFFDAGMTFSYESTANSLLTFQDRSAILKLYETTLYSSNNGLNLITGSLIVDGQCPVLSDAVSAGQGINIGDGVSVANNLLVQVLAESGFNVQRGYLVYRNV